MLPLAEQVLQCVGMTESGATVEVFLVSPVAPLDFAVAFGVPAGNMLVFNHDIMEMPGKVDAELGAVVGLNPLSRHGQALAHLLNEGNHRLDLFVVVDLQHSVPGGLIDRRELVEAPGAPFQVFHIDLYRLAWDPGVPLAAGPWAVAFEGHARHAMFLEDPENRGGRDLDLVVPLQEHAEPHSLAFLAHGRMRATMWGGVRTGLVQGPRGWSRSPARPAWRYRSSQM